MYQQTWKDIVNNKLVKQERNPNMYKYYKGGIYVVLNIANHSETQEKMVVYQKLDDDIEKQLVWVRPYDMFIEQISVDGKIIPRFKKIY